MEADLLQSKHIEIIKVKQSKTEQDDKEMESILPAIGLLRTNWKDKNKFISCFNYGTAFALTDRILITCLHNVYNQMKKLICSEILFYPGLVSGGLEKVEYFREARPKDFWESVCYKAPMKSLSIFPLKEELCMISLERPLKNDKFLSICHTTFEINQQTEIYIVGYPSISYYSKLQLSQVKANRLILKGKVHSINTQFNHILNHTITSTSIGCSGGPILIKDKSGKFRVIGMHTHRGFTDEFNSGIYFNEEMQRVIKSYEDKLREVYNLQNGIDYSQSVMRGYSVDLNAAKNDISRSEVSVQSQEEYQDDEQITESKRSKMISLSKSYAHANNAEEVSIEQSSLVIENSIYIDESIDTNANFSKILSQLQSQNEKSLVNLDETQ